MADTQWPRYQVFLQEKPDSPHQDVGSIHAPDPVLALLNARDVFVRRPACVSLWIAPATAIYSGPVSGTIQNIDPSGESETYFIFGKLKTGGSHAFLGTVQASSPSKAFSSVPKEISTEKPLLSWWVIPARSVLRSEPADNESFFEPAKDKLYRRSTDFHTVSAMRQIKSSRGGGNG